MTEHEQIIFNLKRITAELSNLPIQTRAAQLIVQECIRLAQQASGLISFEDDLEDILDEDET